MSVGLVGKGLPSLQVLQANSRWQPVDVYGGMLAYKGVACAGADGGQFGVGKPIYELGRGQNGDVGEDLGETLVEGGDLVGPPQSMIPFSPLPSSCQFRS